MKPTTYKMFAGILILALSFGNCSSLWAADFAASRTAGTPETPTVVVPDGTSATAYSNGTVEQKLPPAPTAQPLSDTAFVANANGAITAPTGDVKFPGSDKPQTVMLPDGRKLNVVSVGGAVAPRPDRTLPKMPEDSIVKDGESRFLVTPQKPQNQGTDRASAVASILDQRKTAISDGGNPAEVNKTYRIPPVNPIIRQEKTLPNGKKIEVVSVKKPVKPNPNQLALLEKRRLAALVSSGMCASAADAEKCKAYTDRINNNSNGLKIA